MRRRLGARALGRWVTVGFLLAVIQARSAQAQFSLDSAALQRPSASAPQRPSAPAVVRVGKWATLAGSVFFGISAYQAHQDAESSYDDLLDRCRTVDFSCLLDENDTYLDPVSERLYDDSQQADRRAARNLIASEILFVATAAGFIWELTHREEEPEIIPFVPRITQSRSETRISWSLSF